MQTPDSFGLVARLHSLFPDTVFVLQPPAASSWDRLTDPNSLAAAASALAAVIVAVYAVRENRRAQRAEAALQVANLTKTRAAEARISAIAFALRQRTLAWLAELKDTDTRVGVDWAQGMLDHHEAEDFERLTTHAPDASPQVAEALWNAYATMLKAWEYADWVAVNWSHVADSEVSHKLSNARTVLYRQSMFLDAAIGAEMRTAAENLEKDPFVPPTPRQ